MANRSYYTTPLFVLTTVISLIVFVDYQATQNFKIEVAEKTAHETNIRTNNFLKNLNNSTERNSPGHIQTPESVRSIYISSWVAGTPSLRNKLFKFINDSKINSVIIDIKDSTGVISFPVDHPLVNELGADSKRIRNIKEIITELHEQDVYVIGRLTSFQDPLLSQKRPDLAFKRMDNGNIWKDRKGLAFINPKNKEAWDYLGDIAEYSYGLGFDEINFDYIRYPSDGNISNIDYEIKPGETRSSTMLSFYKYLDNRLGSKNIPISADIFGLVTTSKDDIGIGQVFEDIYPYFDAIVPMVYPSHYSPGFFGYDNPNANPYGVVKKSMQSAYDRAVAMNENPDKLRTWLQDFSLGSPYYGEIEVRAQIDATYDIGLDSYMSWDPKNKYTKNAYK